MLLTAYLLRLREDDDQKWYEVSIPGVERSVDVRPFNPFASYLFVADLLKRWWKGTLYDTVDTKDILQGIFSMNLRAGTGLYALEHALDGLSQLRDTKKFKEFSGRMLGEYVAGFLTPFQQVKDVLAQFVGDMAVVRDRNLEPFLGPLKDKLPGLVEAGLAQEMPPAYTGTRAAPITRQAPLLRQLTGITLGEAKNPAERELARLQFDRREILPRSGDPMLDNLWAKHLGALVEERLAPYVEQPEYEALDPGAKMRRLRQRLVTLRAIAKNRAAREMREAGEGERLKAIREERVPKRERFYREERDRERGAEEVVR